MADLAPYGQVKDAPAGSAKPPVVSGIVCSHMRPFVCVDESSHRTGWVLRGVQAVLVQRLREAAAAVPSRSGESARPSCSRAITRLTWVPISGGLGTVQSNADP